MPNTPQPVGTMDLTRTGNMPPAEGTHRLKIMRAEYKKAQSTGNPMIEIQYQILGDSDPDKGKTLFDNLMLMENSRFRVDAFLDAIAAPAAGQIELSKFIVSLPGKTLRAYTIVEVYEGQKKGRIKNFVSATEPESVSAPASATGGAQSPAPARPGPSTPPPAITGMAKTNKAPF